MARWKKGEGLGLGLVRSRSFGRKRVALPIAAAIMEEDDHNGAFISTTDSSPPKRHCSEVSFPACQKSVLDALPQDVLIRIVCGVEHDDLKRLFHVSKGIREATLVAKKWHFEYSTPRKTVGFKNRNCTGKSKWSDVVDEVEAPNAPLRQFRVPKSRLNGKKLADLSVELFATNGDDNWPRRRGDLFMEMEEAEL
ncbi:unnamed protein product [Cuscuta epithymum]|uniref:F-box domain-containing protein n=2 Tax=Cuscuta epithymum TaxID=186058 RepID=A0AAV0FDQ5_9ASTE|nr:unnamed protein product [Cuscuta epithymum]